MSHTFCHDTVELCLYSLPRRRNGTDQRRGGKAPEPRRVATLPSARRSSARLTPPRPLPKFHPALASPTSATPNAVIPQTHTPATSAWARTNYRPPPTGRRYLTANRLPFAAKQLPPAPKRLSPATKRLPRAAKRLQPAFKRMSPAHKCLPPATYSSTTISSKAHPTLPLRKRSSSRAVDALKVSLIGRLW